MLGGVSAGPTTGVDATRRTRLANERTFLAWWRTAIATEGLALASGKVVPEIIDGPQWPYVALGLLLSLLGTALALCGWWRHATVDRALHGGEEAAPPGWLIASLGAVLAVAGALIAVLILAA
jgi:putative membrane protein